MKPFNLAEARIAERVYCKQQLDRRIRIAALLIGLTVLVAAGTFGCRTTVSSDARQVNAQLARAKERSNIIAQEMAGLNRKVTRRQWQEQLTSESKRWLGVIDSVLGSVPGDVWLSRVESSEKTSSVTVEGHAASFEALSGMISALSSAPKFSDVRLASTHAAGSKGLVYIDFSLIASVKKPAEVAASGQVPDVKGAVQ
jgi:Tfp pilus assembly protein PilN